MKKSFSLILMICLLFWSAYSENQKSNATVEILDGIEYIHNTATPLHPEKTVNFVEDLSISGEDKEGNIILFAPRLQFVDDNENIYISEDKDQVIKILDSGGNHIKTIGAQGSGPGEFQRIWHLSVTKDGTLVVLDLTARRTNFFDSSGQFLKSFHWRTGYFNYILIKSSSYIAGERAYSGIIENGFFYVKEIDFNGEEIRSYGEFTMPESLIIREGESTTYTGLPVTPSSIFAGDQDREIFYHCLNNRYSIDVYDTSGKLFRKIDRPYKPVPFTNKDAEEYRTGHDAPQLSDAVKRAIKNLKMPKVKNIAVRMYVDDKNNLWIRTNETKEDKDKTLVAYDVFDSDGYYYVKVWTGIFPQIFKKGKMYRMDMDQETGYQTLKRYKVVWN
jgi:hypothetical protein